MNQISELLFLKYLYWFGLIGFQSILESETSIPFPDVESSSGAVKPLAICDFKNGKLCGWINEETNWGHRWRPLNGSLCLQAKQSFTDVPNSEDFSWLQEFSSEGAAERETDISTRFKSPPIKAIVGLKCIGFDYSLNIGREKHSISTGKSLLLSVFQQQKGYIHLDFLLQNAPPFWYFNGTLIGFFSGSSRSPPSGRYRALSTNFPKYLVSFHILETLYVFSNVFDRSRSVSSSFFPAVGRDSLLYVSPIGLRRAETKWEFRLWNLKSER